MARRAAAVTLGVLACTGAGLPAVWAPAATRGAVLSALAQLRWLVRASAQAPVPAGQIRGHFNAVELAEVGGPAVVNQALEQTGALALRPVTIASFTAGAALVTAGVQDGDRIVTLGVQKLVPGQKVRAFE